MAEFPLDFIEAFNLTMQYEVGSFFDPTDPVTISGDISTKENKRKVGYVNHPNDPGGETKFGVAQVHNPEVNVKTLTLEQAMQIYYEKYWLHFRCNELVFPLSLLHFDANVNHRPRRAAKLLQAAVGAHQDGIVGSKTIQAANEACVWDSCEKQLLEREAFFIRLADAKPNLKVFLKGWLNRVDGLQQFVDKLQA